MPFGGLLTLGLIGGGSSLFSGILGSKASGKASQQQGAAADKAIDFQKEIYGDQRRDQQPYQDLGTAAIAQLMKRIGMGTPDFQTPDDFKGPDDFTAPSLEEARNSPGYQFAKQEGESSIVKGQAAAGGAFTGGTLRALDSFGTGLADSTYSNVFNRSLSTYKQNLDKNLGVFNTNLNKNLGGYQANLAGDAQEFSQLLAPAQLGENATAQIGNVGSHAATSIADLMTGKGNAQAAGTVGSANAWGGALSGLSQTANDTFLLSEFMKRNKQQAPKLAAG